MLSALNFLELEKAARGKFPPKWLFDARGENRDLPTVPECFSADKSESAAHTRMITAEVIAGKRERTQGGICMGLNAGEFSI